MEIEILIETMAKEINSGNFKLQVVFNRNIAFIEEFKKQGFMSKRMNELLNEKINQNITDTHFLNLVFRANKKLKKLGLDNGTPQTIEDTNTIKVDELEPSKVGSKPKLDESGLSESIDDWLNKTNLNISLRQAQRLEKLGINTDKLNERKFTTTQQVSGYLTKLEHHDNKRK